MISAAALSRRGYQMVLRGFSRGRMIFQGLAFKLFLSFFPALLVSVGIAPLLGAAILGILGRPLRRWIAHEIGKHNILQGWWNFFFPAAAMVLAMMALTVIYRVARPQEQSLRNVLPGAMVATLLWWLVDRLFGIYVRRVPYSIVYGGLAAVIGLIIWMQLSAVIIFLGAAWNAELAESRKEARVNA